MLPSMKRLQVKTVNSHPHWHQNLRLYMASHSPAFSFPFHVTVSSTTSLLTLDGGESMAALNTTAALTLSALLLSAASVALVFLFPCFSDKHNTLAPSYFASQPQLNIPMVELVAAATRAPNDPSRAALSSEFSSKFRPTVARKAEDNLEQGLARARAAIRKAASIRNLSVINKNNSIPSSAVYRNPSAFFQSYKEMERRFKVYAYQEGELPMVHDGPCKDIYTSEGRFIHEMEHGNNRFKTSNAREAHVYFMPFSVAWMVKYLYEPNSYNLTPLKEFVLDYVKLISARHPFWNRTQGADHFMLSCHDWGPHASQGSAFLYNTSIRVLCNANSSEGFNPRKDVSLPEIHLQGGNVNPKLLSPPPSKSFRPYLAFFAGGVHGPIRPILLHYWRDGDSDLRVYEYLPKVEDYYDSMLGSKFCLCPSGYEVASPRIVEAIYAECIPVILSDHYVLPFSDVLRWEAFSIQVEISEIRRLKEILMGVSEDEYERMKEGLRAVRRHFVWNKRVQRFDMFHMILHSVWLRRLNVRIG